MTILFYDDFAGASSVDYGQNILDYVPSGPSAGHIWLDAFANGYSNDSGNIPAAATATAHGGVDFRGMSMAHYATDSGTVYPSVLIPSSNYIATIDTTCTFSNMYSNGVGFDFLADTSNQLSAKYTAALYVYVDNVTLLSVVSVNLVEIDNQTYTNIFSWSPASSPIDWDYLASSGRYVEPSIQVEVNSINIIVRFRPNLTLPFVDAITVPRSSSPIGSGIAFALYGHDTFSECTGTSINKIVIESVGPSLIPFWTNYGDSLEALA